MEIGGKRGQITLFIILGVVVLLVIAFLAYYGGILKKVNVSNVLPVQLEPIRNSVSDCINKIGSDGLFLLGLRGGYINVREPLYNIGENKIAYAYYKGKNLTQSLTVLRNELSDYISETLPNCVDLSKFTGYDITTGKVVTSTEIVENLIRISVNYPLTIRKGATVNKLEDGYMIEFPLRLEKIYYLMKDIIAMDGEVSITYLLDTGLDVTIYTDKDKSTVIYEITDFEYKLDNKNYTYRFAQRFAD